MKLLDYAERQREKISHELDLGELDNPTFPLGAWHELNLEERKHFQEWIANEPSSLGEDGSLYKKSLMVSLTPKNDSICLPLTSRGDSLLLKINLMIQDATRLGKL